MTKANIIGTSGTVLLAFVWITAFVQEMLSPAIVWAMLAGCAIACVFGLLATAWGRKWWLFEAGGALLTAAFVLVGLVGP